MNSHLPVSKQQALKKLSDKLGRKVEVSPVTYDPLTFVLTRTVMLDGEATTDEDILTLVAETLRAAEGAEP